VALPCHLLPTDLVVLALLARPALVAPALPWCWWAWSPRGWPARRGGGPPSGWWGWPAGLVVVAVVRAALLTLPGPALPGLVGLARPWPPVATDGRGWPGAAS
jgi:hypothetical protein